MNTEPKGAGIMSRVEELVEMLGTLTYADNQHAPVAEADFAAHDQVAVKP
jgi:hypothetical protein